LSNKFVEMEVPFDLKPEDRKKVEDLSKEARTRIEEFIKWQVEFNKYVDDLHKATSWLTSLSKMDRQIDVDDDYIHQLINHWYL